MEKFFAVDGKFYTFMSKVVDIGFVSLLWLVGCLPVITIVTSTASMYQTVVKCIRYEQGRVFEVFKDAYIKNLRQGMALTAFYSLLGVLIGLGDYYIVALSKNASMLSLIFAVGLLMLSFLYILNVLWVAPVFSRFENSFGNTLKLVYVVALRNFLKSIPLILMVTGGTVVFLAWNELFIAIPGLLALGASFLIEPSLHRFMPPQEEDNGDWRYGFT